MVDGKLLHRIVVWPTYEDAVTAEQEAASADCKRSARITAWPTYEQAAAHVSAGSGGGGGDYHADAVHFNGIDTILRRGAALTGLSATPKCLVSGWYANVPYPGSILAFYPNSNWLMYPINPEADVEHINFAFYRADGMASIFPTCVFNLDDLTTWHHYLLSVDNTLADPDKRVQYWVDGSESTNYTPSTTPGFDFDVPDGDFIVGADGYGTFGEFDAADIQLWFGIAPDLTNPANVSPFISGGKPVNPLVAAAAFGDPIVCLSGDAASFGNNSQGTGGSLTGTPPTNASTSPSD